jgi:uncharacterized membrane protein
MSRGPRLDSVDLLRGIVMVVMALDHVRAFFGTSGWDPEFAAVSAPTFLTRWITHFCAPVFVLLAGTGAALSLNRGRSRPALARFLLTRGAWLALLDVTLVSFAWFFRIGEPWVSDVMWVIGWSFIVLAALVLVALRAVVTLGLAVVVGHNALDGIHAASFHRGSWIWTVLHEQGVIRLPWGGNWFVGYPLVPWVGVMALGYALGFTLSGERRAGVCLAGDLPAEARGDALRPERLGVDTLLERALERLGLGVGEGACAHLEVAVAVRSGGRAAALDRVQPSERNPLLVFGRVPLFYYVVHLYLIHLAAALVFLPRLGGAAFHIDPDTPPAGFGVSIGPIYVIWTGAVLAMYPLCRWFAGVKKSRRSAWLSYL